MAKRRDLIRMTPEEIDEFLHGRRMMNIATHNHDGTIHLVAMWYGFTPDGRPAFETFAKSQKIQNLRREPGSPRWSRRATRTRSCGASSWSAPPRSPRTPTC